MSRSVAPNIEMFAEIRKVDAKTRTVFGYASTETRDRQGEIVTRDAIAAALPGYMLWKNVREMHQPSAVGTAIEAQMDNYGLWFGCHVSDDRAWKKVEDGVYKGFSIGGRVTARDGEDKTKVTGVDITEISLVDRPANPDARFELIKRAGDHLVMQPIQYWGCGCADHQHLAKAEAQECMADAAEALAKSWVTTDELVRYEAPALDPKAVASAVAKRNFSAEARDHAADSGAAMEDGSFPILNKQDLHNAVLAHGRAKDPEAAKAHIISRAKTLGAESMLPEGWTKTATTDDLGKATPRHIEGGKFAGHLKSAEEAGKLAKTHADEAAKCGKLCAKHELLAEESAKAGNTLGMNAHRTLAKAHKAMATRHETIADKYTRLAAKHGDWSHKHDTTSDHPVTAAKDALAGKLAKLKIAA